MTTLYILSTRYQPSALFNLISIKDFCKHNFNITFINITKLYPNIPQTFELKEIYKETVTYLNIESIHELHTIIEKEDKASQIALFIGWVIKEQSEIINLFKSKSIFTISLNLLPINKPNYKALISNHLKNLLLQPKNLTDAIIVDGYYKTLLFKAMGYKNIWSIHSHIYEEYNRHKETSSLTEEQPYILYIDQNFSQHPDFKWFNINKESFGAYYTEVKNILLEYAEHFNMPVKIALHPTADEDYYKKEFPNFELIKGNTFELINYAKLVIGHYSNIIDYAILSKKKIVLIDIPHKISQKISDNQKIYSNKTGIKSVSPKSETLENKNGSESKLNKYIHLFIKAKDSPKQSFSNIFFMHLNSVVKDQD